MNILVCISVVPDTTSKINFTESNTKFDNNGITFIINPLDEFCLTKAIFIKESSGANITVLNVGQSGNDPILRKALAIGADNAIRIDADPKESLSVSSLISNHIKEKEYDIIFCGKESIDYNGGKVPGFISSILNIPFINACVGLELENEFLITKNEIDDGIQTCKCKKPIIIAGQKGLVEEKDLRIPSMRGIMTARTKPLEIIESNITSEKNIKIINHDKPLVKSECKIMNEDDVEKLVELLANEAKVI